MFLQFWKNQSHEFLFKYFDQEGAEETLKHMTLRYTPSVDLNDPFECMPGGFRRVGTWHLRNMICDVGDRSGGNGLARKWKYDRVTRLLDLFSVKSADVKKVKKSRNEYDGRGYQNDFSSAFGCCSFSETNDSLLMWSHYAENHHGLVMCFRTRSLLHDQITLSKIRYRRNRVFQSDPTPENVLDLILTTKSRDWSYEKEWRAYKHLDLLCHPCNEEGIRKTDRFGKALFTNPMVGSSIVSITFGMRFDFNSSLFQVVKAFKEDNPSCRLFQAKHHPHKFSLVIEPFKND